MNGWAPAQVVFDVDGNVVSVTVSEPRFTPEEKALLLASRQADLEPRGAHGRLLVEATDPANQYAYRVDAPTTDFAQEALSRAQRAYQKKYPDADLSALLWRVEKR